MNLGKLASLGTSPGSGIGVGAFTAMSRSKISKAVGLTLPGMGLFMGARHQKMAKPGSAGTISNAPNTAGLDTSRGAYVTGNDTGYSNPRNQYQSPGSMIQSQRPGLRSPQFPSNASFTNNAITSNIAADNSMNGIL